MTPRFGIVGAKNTGKTTLVCALVSELSERGLRIATVKHAHHALEVDRPGTDSHAHRLAGAAEVAVVGSSRWAIMHELRNEREPSLDEIVARMSSADLILIEGYKGEPHPKIEIRIDGRESRGPACRNVVAMVGDGQALSRDDTAKIADLVLRHVGRDGAREVA